MAISSCPILIHGPSLLCGVESRYVMAAAGLVNVFLMFFVWAEPPKQTTEDVAADHGEGGNKSQKESFWDKMKIYFVGDLSMRLSIFVALVAITR